MILNFNKQKIYFKHKLKCRFTYFSIVVSAFILFFGCASKPLVVPNDVVGENDIKVYKRIIVNGISYNPTKTGIFLSKDDLVLILASGKVLNCTAFSNPDCRNMTPKERLYMIIGNNEPVPAIPRNNHNNQNLFISQSFGELEFIYRDWRKKNYQYRPLKWYLNNSGSYLVDVFITSKHKRSSLLKHIKRISFSNPNDVVFQSHAKNLSYLESLPLQLSTPIDKEYKKPSNKISEQVQTSKKNLQQNNKSLSTATTHDRIPDLSGIDFGRYFSLVIGNNNYQTLPKLKTAKNDAQVISGTLKRSYGFNVELLIDATRSDILLALTKLRRKLTKRDNLLIYYAGHGWLDKEADEGYWLPTDAEEDNTVNWVSNSFITSTLRAIEAKHVLIVADSCYSGKLGRGLHIRNISPSYLDRISKKKARSVISSGGLEPVIDSGGEGRHSVFASVFLSVLRENKGVMDGTQLFLKIRRPVMLNADQTPEYSDIRKAGHQGGDFLFVRRN